MPAEEFVDVALAEGVRVGIVGRGGLVGRGCVSTMLPDGRIAVAVDGSARRFFFERTGAVWTNRHLSRSQFRSVRFVVEPPAAVSVAPLPRKKIGRPRRVAVSR